MCDILRNAVEQNMGERSATSEPHILCYTPRAVAIAEARVQRGATNGSK